MKVTLISDEELKSIFNKLRDKHPDKIIRAWMIRAKIFETHNVDLDESTLRGRFIKMNMPLNKQLSLNDEKQKLKEEQERKQKEEEERKNKAVYSKPIDKNQIKSHLLSYVPTKEEFVGYVTRVVDRLLSIAYDTGKHPLTQGKQGTGKTFAHKHYAYQKGLPFFLFSCYEDMKLNKMFGDKTIKNGSIEFQESILVEACQSPSVILFDEINAVDSKQTFDWHALLQNRELYIKDVGKTYKLHPECRIGFAQNPKSSKYIGGNILPSNFLGRCTFITFPEFDRAELKVAMKKRYPDIAVKKLNPFISFFMKITELIKTNDLQVDVSIRQLINLIDLYNGGLSLKEALECSFYGMLDAISNPDAKQAFDSVALTVFPELVETKLDEETKENN